MVDGDGGDRGESAISLVIAEDKQETENVTHQLKAMEVKIVLEVKLKHDNVTPMVVVKIIGPLQNVGSRRKIAERTASRKTAEKHAKSAPLKTLVITKHYVHFNIFWVI